jgi:hypothetical protein
VSDKKVQHLTTMMLQDCDDENGQQNSLIFFLLIYATFVSVFIKKNVSQVILDDGLCWFI